MYPRVRMGVSPNANPSPNPDPNPNPDPKANISPGRCNLGLGRGFAS